MTYNTIRIFYGGLEDENTDVIETKALVGRTVVDALDMALPAPELMDSAFVFVNACYVSMLDWGNVRLKHEDTVNICFTPDTLKQMMLYVPVQEKSELHMVAPV